MYKYLHLAPHKNRLHTLLDDNRWQKELIVLDITMLELHDCAELVSVLVWLLFGMVLEKRMQSHRAGQRAAMLGMLSRCMS